MISKVKTKDGYEIIEAASVKEYKPLPCTYGKMQRFKKVYEYTEDFATLDTETSHDGLNCGWIYQWAFHFNGQYVYGRTPSDMLDLFDMLREAYDLREDRKMIIYIHNASYDLQYLKHWLITYDQGVKFMAIDNHTVLICDFCGFRILCSYKLSNMSLDLFSRTYAEKYVKATGEIDYTVVRYQDTELTDTDWFYMFSDVASQHDAISGYLKAQGYDYAYKAPFTSTGFVRTDCRHAAEKDRKWRDRFRIMALDRDKYNLLRQAFMGGITIANFNYTNEVVEDVGHKDFTSSYPARQMMDYFPTGHPCWYGHVDDLEELELLCSIYCVCFMATFNRIEMKEGITAPYIPSSKCLELKGSLKINGKVIYADRITIALTELDYKCIKRQYDYELESVSNVLVMSRGPAPEWLKGRVMKFYADKCSLKKSDPRLYAASKEKLNGIYGMSATAIVRDEFDLKNDTGLIEAKTITPEDVEKQLNKFYGSRNSFMPYQFGVWTTAHARNALMEMIEAVGYDNFLYCDTDSVFYRNNPESERRLAEMNDRIRERAMAAGAYIGDNVLGVATDEEPIRKFKALHAKCYCAEEWDPKVNDYRLKVTIAGIPKKSTWWENGTQRSTTNAEELGSIDNLKDGFTFWRCGGTRAVYIEEPIRTETINGHRTELASAVIIDTIEKKISDTMWATDKDFSILNIKQVSILE